MQHPDEVHSDFPDVSAVDGKVTLYTDAGSPIWQVEWNKGLDPQSATTSSDNLVFVGFYNWIVTQHPEGSEPVEDLASYAVTALRRSDGAEVWTAALPTRHLYVTGDTLIGFGITRMHSWKDETVPPYWMVAVRCSDGEELFRRRLPADAPGYNVRRVAGNFFLADTSGYRVAGQALLYDSNGSLLFSCEDERVLDVVREGDDLILATDRRVLLVDDNGGIVWEIPLHKAESNVDAEASWVRLSDGDIVFAVRGSESATSTIVRVRPSDRRRIWEVQSKSPSWPPRQYFSAVELETRQDHLFVIRQTTWEQVAGPPKRYASVSALSLADGQELASWEFKD